MSLERLVVCTCGHCIDAHEARGCCWSQSGHHCRCALTRDRVVDELLLLEREAIRRQWSLDERATA